MTPNHFLNQLHSVELQGPRRTADVAASAVHSRSLTLLGQIMTHGAMLHDVVFEMGY
jgi:hypothetical protein